MTWENGRLVGFDYELKHEREYEPSEPIHKIKEPEPEIIIKHDLKFGKIIRGNKYCTYCHSYTKCRGGHSKICLKCFIYYRTYGHILQSLKIN